MEQGCGEHIWHFAAEPGAQGKGVVEVLGEVEWREVKREGFESMYELV